jgi:hypothetical protein
MPRRELTAIVGAATVVIAPTVLATATPAHAATPTFAPHTPAAASPIPEGCELTLTDGPYKYGDGTQVFARFTGGYCGYGSGTVRLFESPDGVHWKTVTTRHQGNVNELISYVTGNCSPGTNWYFAGFVPDDGSFKSSSPLAQFTC